MARHVIAQIKRGTTCFLRELARLYKCGDWVVQGMLRRDWRATLCIVCYRLTRPDRTMRVKHTSTSTNAHARTHSRGRGSTMCGGVGAAWARAGAQRTQPWGSDGSSTKDILPQRTKHLYAIATYNQPLRLTTYMLHHLNYTTCRSRRAGCADSQSSRQKDQRGMELQARSIGQRGMGMPARRTTQRKCEGCTCAEMGA